MKFLSFYVCVLWCSPLPHFIQKDDAALTRMLHFISKELLSMFPLQRKDNIVNLFIK